MTKLIDEKDLLNIEEGLASFGKINNAVNYSTAVQDQTATANVINANRAELDLPPVDVSGTPFREANSTVEMRPLPQGEEPTLGEGVSKGLTEGIAEGSQVAIEDRVMSLLQEGGEILGEGGGIFGDSMSSPILDDYNPPTDDMDSGGFIGGYKGSAISDPRRLKGETGYKAPEHTPGSFNLPTIGDIKEGGQSIAGAITGLPGKIKEKGK